MPQQTSPVPPNSTKDCSHPAVESLEQQDGGSTLAVPRPDFVWPPEPRSEVRRQMRAYNQAREDQEELQLAIATQESLTDAVTGSVNDECKSFPARIAERMDSMVAMLDNELPLICDPSGDTWVFIDPPAQPAQCNECYEDYVQRYRRPFLMRAKFLLELESAFFERALSPTHQYRVIRRHGLVGKLPDSIKYVLDLTPPIEGEDAVYITTELCCAQGVLQWFKSTERWGVSKSLIGGAEECSLQGPSPRRQPSQRQQARDVLSNLRPADGEGQSIPLEYTQLRHRAAIERVLIAVQGQDPQINSAPKMFTTFAVAKYFGIIHSPLTDYIVRWLRAYPNSYFIEVLPEVSLKVADGLQCQQLCRDAFAILVGEEALANTHRCRDTAREDAHSVHGRKRDDLPELYQTRVEYGSKAFLDRIATIFEDLAGQSMMWMTDLPEYQKLVSIDLQGVTDSKILVSLKDRLQAYIRGAIYKVLCSNFLSMPGAKEGKNGDDDLFPRTNWTDIWNRLLPRERILTRSFWRALRNQDIIYGSSNFDLNEHMVDSYFDPDSETTDVEESMLSKNIFTKVYKAELEDLAIKLELLSNAHRVPGSDYKILPTESADLANRGTRDDAVKTGGIADSNPYGTVEPAFTMAPTLVSMSTEEGMTSGFQAQAEEDEDTKRLLVFPNMHNATNVAEEKRSTVCFAVSKFLNQVRAYIHPLCDRMLGSDDIYSPLELELTDTLVCLEDTEWKYLPIWANGNDDGSGGVYSDEVPLALGGFSTAGPSVHTGAGSSTASSDTYEVVGSQSDDSTRNTSTIVNDGRSSVLHPMRTYAMSESGESWNSVPTGDHGEVTGLHTFSGNPPSTGTRPIIPASDAGMLDSLKEIDIDEEAKANWDMATMEHVEMATAAAASQPPMIRDMEEAISNAFLEEDDNENEDYDDDNDSSATELGDCLSDNDAIDEVMEDLAFENEDEDMVIV